MREERDDVLGWPAQNCNGLVNSPFPHFAAFLGFEHSVLLAVDADKARIGKWIDREAGSYKMYAWQLVPPRDEQSAELFGDF